MNNSKDLQPLQNSLSGLEIVDILSESVSFIMQWSDLHLQCSCSHRNVAVVHHHSEAIDPTGICTP